MPHKKKSNITLNIIVGIIVYFFVLFYACHANVVYDQGSIEEGMTGLVAILTAVEHIQSNPLDFLPIDMKIIGIATFIYVIVLLLIYANASNKKNLRPGVENGSAKWNTDMNKYNKIYTSPHDKKDVDQKNFGWVDIETNQPIDLVKYNKNYKKNIEKKKEQARKEGKAFIYKPEIKPINQNMILSNNVFLSMDGKATRRNCNTVIVGGSGSGKSRFLVKPNVLQENCSFIITDPGGFLMGEIGNFFVERGYDVKLFNLVEMEHSNRYNPFNYIRDEIGVLTMIDTLIRNTTPDGASKGDPFWEKSETALLQALCFYLFYECPPEERNFANVMKLLRHAEVKEDQEDYESDVDIMFKILKDENPEHIAVRSYAIFKQAAGKTAKSILISCSTRLQVFNMKAVENLTSVDDIDLMTIGDKPTVLFCVLDIVNPTYNFLVAMMYTQLFESLYFHASTECANHRLPIHVRFMLDEFANVGRIPEFEQKVATMRNFDISVTIILQNMAQLKTMYKDSWESITGNCDTFIFLGGQEQTTLEYVSKKLGKETIQVKNTSRTMGSKGSSSQSYNTIGRELMTPDEIARMDNGYCIAFLRGELPFYTKKYDYPRHKNYKYTGDSNKKKLYRYQDHFNTAIEKENTSEYQEFLEEAKNLIKTEAIKTDVLELELQKAPIREETSKGVETLQEKTIDENFLEEIGLSIDEINQNEIDDVLELESAYDPDSEYGGYEDEDIDEDDFLK